MGYDRSYRHHGHVIQVLRIICFKTTERLLCCSKPLNSSTESAIPFLEGKTILLKLSNKPQICRINQAKARSATVSRFPRPLMWASIPTCLCFIMVYISAIGLCKNQSPSKPESPYLLIMSINCTVSNDLNSQRGPTSSYADRSHNSESSADPNSSRSKSVASSTAYMPQSGKEAGIVGSAPHQQDRHKTNADPDERRREDVAGSTRWIPMAGKPTKTSSL